MKRITAILLTVVTFSIFMTSCNGLIIKDSYGFNDEDLNHLKTELMTQVVNQNGGGSQYVEFLKIDIMPYEGDNEELLVFGSVTYHNEQKDLELLQSFVAKKDGSVVLTSQPINAKFFTRK
jgi:hypothetical protein